MNASTALSSAREYLNDSASTLWSDSVLIPKLQEAHRKMQVKLQLSGIPVIKAVSVVISVPAHTMDLSSVTGYPTDLIEPKQMKERAPGERDENFIDMTQVDWIPDVQQSQELVWWCWIGEKITLLGATTARQIQLRYIRGITLPTASTSPLGFLFAENYLGPKTAALAAVSTGDNELAMACNSEADAAFDEVKRMNIRGLQNLPARRRGYHRGRGRTRAIRDF